MCTTEAREGPAAAATRRPRFTPMAFRARRTRAAEAEAELAPRKRTAHLQPRVLTSAAAEGLASSSFDTTPDVSQTARRDARVTKKSFIKDPMTRPRVIGRRPCLTARLSIGVSEPRRRRGDRASSSPPGRHARASDLTRRGTFRAHLSNGVVSSWFSNHRRLTIDTNVFNDSRRVPRRERTPNARAVLSVPRPVRRQTPRVAVPRVAAPSAGNERRRRSVRRRRDEVRLFVDDFCDVCASRALPQNPVRRPRVAATPQPVSSAAIACDVFVAQDGDAACFRDARGAHWTRAT